MVREDEEMPEAPVQDVATPEGDIALEAGTEGTELASEARSPDSDTLAAQESEAGEHEQGATSESSEVNASEHVTRTYRPTEDYVIGDTLYHAVWDAVGVVTDRDAREQIFRIPIGRVDERGRCNLITVQFDKDVPASGGARSEVKLIANWRGRAFEVGAPQPRALPEPETLLGGERDEEERPAIERVRPPALPEIPEPEDEIADEDLGGEDQAPEEDTEAVEL